METEPLRRGFTIKDLLAITAVVAVLLALLLPANRHANEGARRNQCSNKLKQIGLGLQNHHDVYKRFPALTNQSTPDGSANVWDTWPGATFSPDGPAPNGYTQSPASAAGYGWIVKILPYIEENVLYNSISRSSNKFQYEAFSTGGSDELPFSVTVNGATRHFATIELDEVRCPTYAGGMISTASSGTARPPVTIAVYAALFNGSARPPTGVAISNYVALSATHLACMAFGPDDPATAAAEPPNGVLVPGSGLDMKSILDGTSRTLIVCETKEPAVNSWYDGTVCWTVGANPNASHPPTRDPSALRSTGDKNHAGRWIVPQGTTNASSLNYGP
ncbi:MAG TPA: DUF1559 domain-containing protein, partial [Pirellulales bacterium]